MSSDTGRRLVERSAHLGIQLDAALVEKLVTYYDLLQRWNQKINLTALTDTDEAIDRLLLEPVIGASALPKTPRLIDLGSGGGSPAIPLALAVSAPLLVMVESRTRKAAFLREAMRVLGLNGCVENSRFEDVAQQATYRQTMNLVSVRAVRVDGSTLDVAASFLATNGRLALFESADAGLSTIPPAFSLGDRISLPGRSRLTVLNLT